MMRTTRIAVPGLCRTAINSTSATIVSMSACQARQAETTQRKEDRAIAKTSLVVDELRRDLSVHGATLRPKASARARAKLVKENTAVADKVWDVRNLFHQLASANGRRDRGALSW
ncbi:hypothetical protein DFH11DRAFT_1542665 [Phellopilus nigrolimitatus]|nr:hypothetical protein DFH11DRAFT_1542665 [Phellopilus nigrolimitatus]